MQTPKPPLPKFYFYFWCICTIYITYQTSEWIKAGRETSKQSLERNLHYNAERKAKSECN